MRNKGKETIRLEISKENCKKKFIWRVDDHALGMKLVMGMVEGQPRAYQEQAMDIVARYITGMSNRW